MNILYRIIDFILRADPAYDERWSKKPNVIKSWPLDL